MTAFCFYLASKLNILVITTELFQRFFSFLLCSGPVCQRVVGGMVWNPVLRRSISSECLETKSLPSRSPPTTPNWYDLQHQPRLWWASALFCPMPHYLFSLFELALCPVILSSPGLSGRRSPRVRHGIRKPRPSSVELTNDLKDMSEGEDVFYTYRASVSSSKDSEGDSSPHQLVSVTTEMLSAYFLGWMFLSIEWALVVLHKFNYFFVICSWI